ncbi:MAG: ComF family protein [Dehalococcoidaceae bacterium]|nr:ComF family protein [Dehalococcoidaceae bacterium]
MLTHLEKLHRMALDLLFPARCLNCGREKGYICPDCMETLERLKPPVCPVCNLPIKNNRQCDCRYFKSLDGLISPFVYQGTIRQALIQFKYHNLRAIAPLLGSLLWECLSSRPVPSDILTPVPLHQKRLRWRGYNQSRLLVDHLSKLSGIPSTQSLLKIQNTPSQVDAKNTHARRTNVESAFMVAGADFFGKRVLVVDDVATTGATLDGCALALKKAGAITVRGLTLAREI